MLVVPEKLLQRLAVDAVTAIAFNVTSGSVNIKIGINLNQVTSLH